MRVSLSLKSRYNIKKESNIEKVKQDMEIAIHDIEDVVWAIFDVIEMKIEVEYKDDTDEVFDVTELVRTVQESGKFYVIGIS